MRRFSRDEQLIAWALQNAPRLQHGSLEARQRRSQYGRIPPGSNAVKLKAKFVRHGLNLLALGRTESPSTHVLRCSLPMLLAAVVGGLMVI
jgi:hypothetical protein